jgi:hypothetical protein
MSQYHEWALIIYMGYAGQTHHEITGVTLTGNQRICEHYMEEIIRATGEWNRDHLECKNLKEWAEEKKK